MRLLPRRHTETSIAQRAEEHITRTLAHSPAILEHGGSVTDCQEIAEGTNSEIWRVELENGTVIARFWPVESWRDKASETAHLLTRLARLDLPVPRLIHSDLSDQTARRFGFRVTVEEFIDGCHLAAEDLNDDTIRGQLVETLLRLHRERSDVAGRPWRRENEQHPWEKWMPHRLDVLIGRARRLCPDEAAKCDRIRRALDAMQPPVSQIAPFHLIHGDVQPANFLLMAGRLRMIDLGTVSHGAFQLDLVLGERAFNARRPGCFQPVLDNYFAQAPPDWGPLHRRHAPFFLAQECLRCAVSAWRKAGKDKYRDQRTDLRRRAQRNWANLITLTERAL